MEIKFTVKMYKYSDKEEIILNVGFDGVEDEIIQKHALANMVVTWQGQIRTHWDAYKEGKMPTDITFGVPLFGASRGRTVTKKITSESANAWLNEGSKLDQLNKKIEMIESMGMEVPDHMWSKLEELEPDTPVTQS